MVYAMELLGMLGAPALRLRLCKHLNEIFTYLADIYRECVAYMDWYCNIRVQCFGSVGVVAMGGLEHSILYWQIIEKGFDVFRKLRRIL